MPPQRPRIKLILLFLAFLGIALAIWPPFQRMMAVAELQGVLELNDGLFIGPGDRAPLLPRAMDEAFYNWLARKIAAREPDRLKQQRMQAFFWGRIEEIRIRNAYAFTGDVGRALQRFPRLKKLEIYGFNEGKPTVEEWAHFCRRLRTMKNLEHLDLISAQLTDEAIAPLAGHPSLRSISFGGPITRKSIATFKSMPNLVRLRLHPRALEELEVIAAELPTMFSAP